MPSLRDRLSMDMANKPSRRQLAGAIWSNQIANGPAYGNGSAPSVQHTIDYNELDPLSIGEHYYAGEKFAEPKKGVWASIFDKATDIFDFLAIPQQVGYQLLTGGDWRKAIPDYIAPDEWEESGIAHETINFSDVLDVWTDHRFDSWYESSNVGAMIGEFAFKTGLFAVDVFTDPLTYLPVGSAVKVARKALPAGVASEFAGKIALRTGKVAHADEWVQTAKKYAENVQKEFDSLPVSSMADGELASVEKRLAAANKQYVTALEHQQEMQLVDAVAARGEVIVEKAGGHEKMAQLGKHIPEDEAAAAKETFKKEIDEVTSRVPNADDDVALHNDAVLGVDSATSYSEALEKIAMGADPDTVLMPWPRVRDYYNSQMLNAPGLHAISTGKGFRAQTVEDLKKVVSEKIALYESRLAEIPGKQKLGNVRVKGKGGKEATKALRAQIKEIDAVVQSAAAPQVGRESFATERKRISSALKRAKKWQKQLDEDKIPDDLLDKGYADVLPNSARRSPMQAEDYLESQWGRYASRVAGLALYPGAILPKPSGWLSHLLREPSRALADASPEMRNRMMDGMRQYNFYLNGVRAEAEKILLNAGVMKKDTAGYVARKAFLHNAKGSVDEVKSKELFDLLNAQSVEGGEEVFQKLYAAASPEMRQAHDDMRALFTSMALKLSIDPKLFREGYVPHIRDFSKMFLDKSWIKNGALPPDMDGMATKGKVWFGHLMERHGVEYETTNMAQILDVYTRGAARKAYIEPMNGDLLAMAQVLSKGDPKLKWVAGYTNHLIENINGTPSKLSALADAVASGSAGAQNGVRFAKSGAQSVATLGYAAALTGNLRYPVMSVLQAMNTTSASYGPLRMLKGLGKMLTRDGRDAAKVMGLDNEVTQIFSGVNSLASRIKLPYAPAIADTELFIRGLTYHAAVGDELTRLGFRTLEEISDEAVKNGVIANAIRATEEANHVFGAVGKPVLFGRTSKTLSTSATQFMSFPFKQTETLLGIGLENPGKFFDYLYMAGKLQAYAANTAQIEVGDYVGIKYIEDIPKILSGERQSIPVQALQNFHKMGFALTAMLDGDVSPDETRAALDGFTKSIEMMVPMKTGIGQLGHAISYAAPEAFGGSGEQGTLDVRKDRRTALHALGLAALGKGSYRELKFGEKQYSKDQADFASVITGMQSLRGAEEQRVANSLWEKGKQTKALQVQLTEKLWDAVRTGTDNPMETRKIVNQLRSLGFEYKDMSDIADRKTRIMYAANMTIKAREQQIENDYQRRYATFLRSSVKKGN